ncbi:sigma-E factor negative regulatory protein [Dyella acidiphila]|uniref:Sigma-E factor negative regulatory protein n=1 Tax=Dyella acidiphila TaxID=2775866 RepID=A0ABR9GB02_9GAMM|nr:sigma-E factor negative regulatory protein [Dyella acidiphila]MBE1161169.1 sigma-E factor negative regulatory protein [Dyella acidiphila]
MSEANKETLSAAMDGELSRDELRFLLRRLDRDASLMDAWARYHVAGDGLRRQLPGVASAGFAARVMDVIEGEQAAPQVSPRRRDWLRLSVGGAIAASVAVAALMVSQPTAPDSEHSPTTASVSPQTTHASIASAAVSASGASNEGLAVVPPSLSAYSASGLSQRASVTLGDPSDNPLFQRYPASQRYSVNGYRALNNHDGSYLLLIDTPQAKAAVQNPAYQAGAGR